MLPFWRGHQGPHCRLWWLGWPGCVSLMENPQSLYWEGIIVVFYGVTHGEILWEPWCMAHMLSDYHSLTLVNRHFQWIVLVPDVLT